MFKFIERLMGRKEEVKIKEMKLEDITKAIQIGGKDEWKEYRKEEDGWKEFKNSTIKNK